MGHHEAGHEVFLLRGEVPPEVPGAPQRRLPPGNVALIACCSVKKVVALALHFVLA